METIEFSMAEILQGNYMSAMAFFLSVSNCLSLVILCYVRRNHRKAFIWLAFMTLAFIIWDFPRGIFCLASNEAVSKYFFRLSYIGISFSGPIFFLFSYMYTFNPSRNPHWVSAIFVIPIITSVMTIVPPLQNFLDIFELGFIFTPSREVIHYPQPFFYIHTIYSYALATIGTSLFFMRLIKREEEKIFPYVIICVISVLFILWNLYATFFATETLFYRCITVFLHLLVANTFFLTMYLNEDEKLVYSGQQNIFSMLPFPVFILNRSGRIVYANLEASLLIPQEKKNGTSAYFADVMRQFDITNMELPKENGGGAIVHIKRGTQDFFLNESSIYDTRKKSSVQGKLIMFVTHSEFTFFFKDIEARAFHDGLSKCFNRHYLELKKKDFTSEKVLPLSFLMCDLDNLKNVNDNFGHNAGDEYITMCAAAINSCIRTTDFLFRLSSDEFLAIMPNVPAKVAVDLKHRLELEVEMRGEELNYPVGISVGTFTVTSLPIDFSAAIHSADESMYTAKRAKHDG